MVITSANFAFTYQIDTSLSNINNGVEMAIFRNDFAFFCYHYVKDIVLLKNRVFETRLVLAY